MAEITCSSCGAPMQYYTDTPERCSFCGSRLKIPSTPSGNTTVPSHAKPKNVVFIIIAFMLAAGMIAGGMVFFLIADPVISEISSGPTATEQHFATEELRIGGKGNGIGKFEDNRAVGIDATGNLYSTDYAGGRIQVFDKNGKFIKQWMNDLQYIQDMIVSRDGSLYMISSAKIYSFNASTGEKLKESKPSFYNKIALSPDGSVLAVNGMGGLEFLNEDLETKETIPDFLKNAGVPNNVTNGIACNGLGEIFLLDLSGKTVYHFSSKGIFKDKFKTNASFGGDIEIDAQGRVFVSSVNMIYIYTDEGEYVDSMPSAQAFGMSFTDDGELWVADRPYLVKYRINK